MRKVYYKISLLFIALLIISLISCKEEISIPTDLGKHHIIPIPRTLESTYQSFLLNEEVGITVLEKDEKWQSIGDKLQSSIMESTGIKLPIKKSGKIVITKVEDRNLGNEGYILNISKKKMTISAASTAGAYYAIMTILQMLPIEKNNYELVNTPWHLPTGKIIDYPEYEYRGTMLDVARHFFTVDEIKEHIDNMALYKLNYLHLHLSDDQGWRIEIKSWPKLTEIGGSTEVGGGPGGFYTQEQYKDIVAYAADHHIFIVPEIDMPGHTNAALASYAELNCNGVATKLYTGTKVGFSTLCTREEITYKFVEDVIKEITALSPGPYFHVGGDESHVTAKDDYIYFMNRVMGIVTKYNKVVMGWDEIATAELQEGGVAQYWAEAENAEQAIKKGGKLLLSPAKKAYLDMQYDSTSQYGLHWASYIEVDEGYNWNPQNYVPGVKKEDIIGIEAPLWSETVSDLDEAEYLVYPRLLGYAELGWSNPDSLSWDNYKIRLAEHGPRLEKRGIKYFPSNKVEWIQKVKD